MTLCILVASWNLGQPLLVGSPDRLPVFSSDSPPYAPSCLPACQPANGHRTYANASSRHLRAFNYFRANLCSLECYNWVWIVSMNMKICENLIKLYVLSCCSSSSCSCCAVTNCFNRQKHLNNLLIKYAPRTHMGRTSRLDECALLEFKRFLEWAAHGIRIAFNLINCLETYEKKYRRELLANIVVTQTAFASRSVSWRVWLNSFSAYCEYIMISIDLSLFKFPRKELFSS